jgi:nitrate reductase assembly molybdenum cofactor insertion protein NarJ
MESHVETLSADERQLLREAAEWRLIGLLFEYPSSGWREQVVGLAAEVTDPRLRAAAGDALEQAAEGVYQSIFGPGGPVSPREVTYLGGIQLGYLLSELVACYDAFAYRPATAEADDHLSVECGFVAYLKLKQAYAISCGDSDHAQVTAEAAAQFLAEHLSAMAEPIGQGLASGFPSYLSLAAELLLERTGPPQSAPAPIPYDEDGAITCGSQS